MTRRRWIALLPFLAPAAGPDPPPVEVSVRRLPDRSFLVYYANAERSLVGHRAASVDDALAVARNVLLRDEA